ncbi:MAG: ABC-F family ATP-binding cassette domain-containing protein [Phycisphaerales bacterium]|nr:ABC-F family ATP-binding cassette domain-containing protein [Phycisphaerales bacterium]
MPVLAATNIRLTYGDSIILDGVSISVEPGERVGVVGRNGTGKSSLLKVLAGLIPPDAGNVSIQRGCRAGYLKQDPDLAPDETLRESAEGAFDELHRLHAELHTVFDAMAAATERGQDAEVMRLLKEQERLERLAEAAGGYAIDHKIDAVLHGLGFTDAQFTIRTRNLSGGQRGRLALARLLLEQPDVLLLDEPTNHLDIEGRLWLEGFLTREYRGAVLMVSHDRYLLDRVVTRIVETEQARLIDYPGNYATFRELRAERRTAQMRAFENQQTKFRKEEAFIRRYRAGQRAKQARGRQSKLTRAREDSTIERPMEMASLDFELPRAERTGDIVLAARGIGKRYTQRTEDGRTGQKVLFTGMDLTIGRGERWGIIGPNGAGKTTLVRCLLRPIDAAGGLEADTGHVRAGSNVKVGYYRQSHEHLDSDQQVYRYLQSVIAKENPGQVLSEQQARNLAGAFLFSGEEQERQLGTLSGGERSRAVLAGLLASAKNLLVLDEPTNHLDIDSSERLEAALGGEGGYEGAMLLISHDRALIDETCDHLIVMDGHGGASVFHGNYTEWHEKESRQSAEAARAAAEEQRRRDDAEKRRRQAEEQRAARARPGPTAGKLAKMKTEQLEARIEEIGARIRAIDESFNDPDVWSDQRRCNRLGDERKKLAEELEPLEFEWVQRAEG